MAVSTLATEGDGIQFLRLTDALKAVREIRISRNELETAACRITISVATGTWPGNVTGLGDAHTSVERFPLVIDVPDISVKGALNMQLDSDGRATGIGEGTQATIIAPSPALRVVDGLSEPIFVINGHPNGSKGNGAVIEGFVFRSGRQPSESPIGGQGVLSMRVRDIVVRGNKFEDGLTEAVDLRASSGVVERNHLTGRGATCDICIAGPGDYTVRDNRLLGPGGIPGILSVPALILPVPKEVEQFVLPGSSLITGVITNNEVRNHLSKPVGAGIRAATVGLGAPNVAGMTRMTITRNTVINNTFGFIVEAGFPVTGSELRGDSEIAINGNAVSQSCQNDLLVSMSRHVTGLGLTTPFPAYLRNSSYALALGPEFSWETAWVAHPPGFGNTLVVNGHTVANGTRTGYDAARTCS